MRFCNLYFTLSTTPPGVGTVSLREYSADNKEAGRKGPQYATILTSAFDLLLLTLSSVSSAQSFSGAMLPEACRQSTSGRIQ
jgi:hypothetical protein